MVKKKRTPDFERGMLVGFADGMSAMHWLLSEAVKDTASTAPKVSAYLAGMTNSMGDDLLEMVRQYHAGKGLSVPFNVRVKHVYSETGEEKWN